jgi:hypothetical protein
MAVKTFSSGEVLTAADTNTYLNNGGLVYVTSQTIGTTVASVTVSNCFSSTYDNYRLVVSGGSASTTANLQIQFSGITGNSYYAAGNYVSWTVATVNAFAPALTNQAVVGNVTVAGYSMVADITGPNLATYKTIYGNSITNNAALWINALVVSTTQSTGFTLSVNSGTMTGGTITVYGYRKA